MPTGFAMMGAMAGSLGGPVGTAIGAAAGGLTGKWGGHSKWKLPAEVYLQSDRDGGVVYNTFRVSADESIAHVRTS